jgi:hypothetical protein
MAKYGYYATTKKEIEGEWFAYGDFDIKMRRASATNKEFAAGLERVSRTDLNRKQRRAAGRKKSLKEMTPEERTDFFIDLYLESVILGWRVEVKPGKVEEGFMWDLAGKKVEFSKETAKAIFLKYPELWTEVMLDAQEKESFAELDEEDLGN